MHDVYGVKLLPSHPNKHKVRYGFRDGTNSICDCGSATEVTLSLAMPAVSNSKIRTPSQ